MLLGLSISCARRGQPELIPGEPREAGQDTPPGVPAVVQPVEPSPADQDVPPAADPAIDQPVEPSPANQDVPAAAAPATDQPREADREAREEAPEVRELLLLGPTYTPHDRAPSVVWDTDAQALVSRRLLPVLQSQGLPARTRALFWILLRPDGSIADVVPQTLSENDRFDAVAGEIVRQLRFTPAIRNDRAVPVWVIQEISLLMQ